MKFIDFLNEEKVRVGNDIDDSFEVNGKKYRIEYKASDKSGPIATLVKANIKSGKEIKKNATGRSGASGSNAIDSKGTFDWSNDEEQSIKAYYNDGDFVIEKRKPNWGITPIKIIRIA